LIITKKAKEKEFSKVIFERQKIFSFGKKRVKKDAGLFVMYHFYNSTDK